MAIVQDTETEQEENQGLDQPKLGGEQTQDLNQGVSATGKAVKSGPSTDRRGTSAGSRLSNLKKYVEANRQAGMAGKIQSGIEDISKGVESQIGESETKLRGTSEAEKSRLSKGEQLIQESQAGGGGVFERGRSSAFTQDISPATPQIQPQGTGTDGPAPQPVQTPDFSQYGATAAERLGEFQRYKAGDVGQLEIERESELAGKIGDLQKRADLSKTEAGRFQLLREQFGRPGYTTGQQRLDQLILQAAPEESQKLQEMSAAIADPATQQLEQIRALKQAEQDIIAGKAGTLQSSIAQQLYGEAGQPVIDPQTGQVTDVGGRLGEFKESLSTRQMEQAEGIGQQFGELKGRLQLGLDVTEAEWDRLNVPPEHKQQLIDYYSRSKRESIAEKVAKGTPFSTNDLQTIGANFSTPMSAQEIQNIQNQQPVPIGQFVSSVGEIRNPGDAATRDAEYAEYVQGIEQNKQNLKNLINTVAGTPEISAYREAPEIDFSKYAGALTEDDIDINRVAMAEDFARQAALEQLSGVGFGPLQQSRIGEAGTVGELGLGRLDTQGAIREGRDIYETPEYQEYDRVSGDIPEGDLLGQSAYREVGELGTALAGENALGQTVDAALKTGMVTSGASIGLDAVDEIVSSQSIKETYDNFKDKVGNVVTGNTYFCTEMTNRGLLSIDDLDILHDFMYETVVPRARFYSWYIDNGPKIIEIANQKGYDWENGVKFVNDTLNYYEIGENDKGIDSYSDFVRELCEFTGERFPEECDNYSITNLLYLPKVIIHHVKRLIKG
jgi:hypothetical protein